MKLKRLLCATLSAALFLFPALAAGDSPAYTVERGGAAPVRVWGSAEELGENRVTLKNSDENDPYSEVVLTVSEDTVILDAVTGAARVFSDLRRGETLYAYVGPAMTMSLPPISNAVLILCNIPADFGVPTWAEVERVDTGAEGGIDALMSGDIVLHLGAGTQLLAAPGLEGAASLDAVRPGTMLLCWYTMVMETYPAQAVPSKIMLFPYGYAGWLRADLERVALNGAALSLTSAQQPLALDGKLMLPLRPVAEALGCKVSWDAANPESISVTHADGGDAYALVLGGDTVTAEGDMVVALTHKGVAVSGVTFLAAEDILRLHHLKLEGAWPLDDPAE